jgi:hypothetical protein
MNFMFKAVVAILVLACTISQSAVAGAFEDGSNAWDRGDYASAMRLLRPLADRGDPKAQNRVGMMYQRGWGVPLNYADAVSWLRRAADQGDADAQNNLAFMYLYGRGVSQDYVSAHMWFSLAASAGVRSASFSRDLLAAKMTPVQVAIAQTLAHEWKPADDRRHLFQLNAVQALAAAKTTCCGSIPRSATRSSCATRSKLRTWRTKHEPPASTIHASARSPSGRRGSAGCEMVDVQDHLMAAPRALDRERPHAVLAHIRQIHRLDRVGEAGFGHRCRLHVAV